MSIERKSSDRRKLRAGMVFVLVVAGTALIGWGGLAAWQAVTQNNGSTASTLGVHMSNVATITGGSLVTCTDANSPGTCGAIFHVNKLTPGYGPTQVGTVTITNTGTEASTFNLQLTSAVVSSDSPTWTSADNTLCASLHLTITDSQPSTLYSNLPLAALPTENLNSSASSLTWNPGDSDTFTFSLALPAASPNTDEDSTCTAVFTWGQNGV